MSKDTVKNLYLKYKKIKNTILIKISPKLYIKTTYKKVFKKKLDLQNPTGFNEKLIWLRFNTYKNNDLIIKCADKYAVREYIEEIGCGEILNELIDVYDSPEEIVWDSLPQKFALKCNHGAGYNVICHDKSKLDEMETKKKLKKWLKENYVNKAGEEHYGKIKRKIICEKFIETKNRSLPTDYKIYCFNGKAKIILVMNDRDTKVTREFYNEKWERIRLRDNEGSPKKPTEKPENLEEMIRYAEKLSKAFPFVRVDLFSEDSRIIFGELTFTPTGCLAQYTDEANEMLGSWLNLKEENV